MSTTHPYDRGLVEVADDVFAYLQPDGTWGWSNAGLVVGADEAALVDTLFDLPLTRDMLDTMAPMTSASPISKVLNTHANGDHCYGNQLVAGPGVDFVASAATADELDDVPASTLGAMVAGYTEGALGDFVQKAFGPFDFSGIEVPPATITFTGSLELDAGGRTIELVEVGPAHTAGDILAWLPEERVLFGGDILFIGGTPIMWAGPVGNWIKACDLIAELDPTVIVPGHGPLTDLAGVRDLRDYLAMVQEMTVAHHAAGADVTTATREIDLTINGSKFAGWTDRERIWVTVHAIWRELEPDSKTHNVVDLFQMMAEDFAQRDST